MWPKKLANAWIKSKLVHFIQYFGLIFWLSNIEIELLYREHGQDF